MTVNRLSSIMKTTALFAAALAILTADLNAQTTGNIAVFRQTETTRFTELRADLEEVGSAKRGARIHSFSTTGRRYVIYDITNGKTAVVAYNPAYLVSFVPYLVKKYYWIEQAPANTFAYTRLPLPQAGTEQWLSTAGDEFVHESAPGSAGLDRDNVAGVETWGLLGRMSEWSGKATPFLFSEGFIAPVPRTITLRGLNVAQEFRYRVSSTYTYLTHTAAPVTGSLVLDTVLTGKANRLDIVTAGNPVIPKRTIENGVEQVIAFLKSPGQGYALRP